MTTDRNLARLARAAGDRKRCERKRVSNSNETLLFGIRPNRNRPLSRRIENQISLERGKLRHHSSRALIHAFDRRNEFAINAAIRNRARICCVYMLVTCRRLTSGVARYATGQLARRSAVASFNERIVSGASRVSLDDGNAESINRDVCFDDGFARARATRISLFIYMRACGRPSSRELTSL